ncbi:restriction endonuclease [Stenotrophomonas sp. NPDC077464]|uniref:nSTAND3 domain-containing NTPase n=1 Tax=unclassified Stenotrophomonas TaxID=196198 RepID=UPI0037D93FD8
MYELHTLGWHSFQNLCLTILREVMGQTVESFLDGNDGGRDGAFSGTWKPSVNENLAGRFVIQCKHTSRPAYVLQLADLTDEVEKAKRLVNAGRCDCYVLLTNAGVTGARVEEIEALFLAAGVKQVVVYGATWLTQQIQENKRLRMLVPRVYGLGDLSQILDERAYAQARAIIESMREDLAKVVVTEAYQRSVDALDRHSFVLLVGEPAAGKTTIASMLAMAALDQWNASLLKLDEPAEVAKRWNPDEPSQFFWLDDAFGVTQYEEFLVHGWNRVLPQLKPMLRRGAKIVMTSRDYIYNRARRDLKESAFPLFKESQVVIDVHELTGHERRQILYNHLKLGKQPRSFLTNIKPFLETVSDHPRFIPEMARRLADPLFTKGLFIDSYYLGQFVEKREQLLHEVLQALDANSKAALALIYMRNDRLTSPIELEPAEVDALQRLGSDLGGCISGLETLAGSLVVRTSASGEALWRFKHPTIGDAYAAHLVQSPDLLGIYLQGSDPARLLEQVSCGDVGIEKAVVVPIALFPVMLSKLDQIGESKVHKDSWLSRFDARRKRLGFLSNRCSKEFLTAYLDKHPKLLASVSSPGLVLSVVPEVRLAARLQALGILPEANRLEFVRTVSQYAIDGRDTDALDNATIREVFTDSEHASLVAQVQAQLLPKLHSVRIDYQSDWDSDRSREDHMWSFLASLENLRRCYQHDSAALAIIESESRQATNWINEDGNNPASPAPRKLGKLKSHPEANQVRGIFDDIDAVQEASEN